MRDILPAVVEIPHAARLIPSEVAPRLLRTERQRENDRDRFANEIFQRLFAKHYIIFDYWRGVIDVNRDRDCRGVNEDGKPITDGIIKADKDGRRKLFNRPLEESLQEQLIENYADPYFRALLNAINDPEVRCLLCSHTMPVHSSDNIVDVTKKDGVEKKVADAPRPFISLINGGPKKKFKPKFKYHLPATQMKWVANRVTEFVSKLDTAGLEQPPRSLRVGVNYPFAKANALKRLSHAGEINNPSLWVLGIDIRRDLAARYTDWLHEFIRELLRDLCAEAEGFSS